MKQKLEENKGIPASLLWMLAIISGLSVANLYYNQPLLNRISEDLGISEFTANLIPMTTQIGYALGLLFIIPLGDLYKRKNIIVINFLLLSVATCSIAMSVNVFYILLASLVTGICSVMPQIFIPIAAQFSLPQNKARNVGMMVSGLLTGILSGFGIGGGSLLLLYLTLFEGAGQYQAGGINLLYFLSCAPAALISHRKNGLIEREAIKCCVPAGVVTSVLSALLAARVDTDLLRRAFGVVLLYIGVKETFLRKK